MLKTFLRRACAALGLSLALAAAPAPATTRAARAACAVGGLGRRHDDLSVRDDPPASREVSMAYGQVRPGGRRIAAAGRRDHRRRQEPAQADVGDGKPRLSPKACRRSPSGCRRRSARRLPRRSRRAAFRPRRSTGWRPGPRRSSCSATSSRTWASRAAKASRPCFATAFTAEGKPIGELESNVEQLGFFDRLPEKRAARSCSKGRSTSPSHDQGIRTACWAPGSRGDVQRDRPRPSTTISPARPSSAGADRAAQRQLEQVDRAAHGAARSGPDRGRRGPSRRQGFGDRDAQTGRLPGPPRAIADAGLPLCRHPSRNVHLFAEFR